MSGSMDKINKKGSGPKKPKIQIARKELLGAIDNTNDGETFNVIFFNHEIVPWQTKMIDSSDATRRRARKWVEKQEPLGGTNIDTIFFLTDGKPTAGKIQDPNQILDQVKEWNRTARVKIHAIGIGDHDKEFMAKLAKIGGGTYVAK